MTSDGMAVTRMAEELHRRGYDASREGIVSVCIEQTSDGTAEMGAALCAAKRRDVQWNSNEPPRFAMERLGKDCYA